MPQQEQKPETGSYLQYKRDQRKVSNWLVDATRHIVGHRHSSDSYLPVRVLLELATAVVAKAITVPIFVLELLSKVINARTKFASWHESLGGDSCGHISHRNFLNVLQDVRNLLQPLLYVERRRQKRHTRSKKNKRLLSKTPADFKSLPIEEPSESPLGLAPAQAIQGSSAELIDADPGEELDDSYFELWCFLQDLNDVKKLIVSTWQEYARGEVSALVASNTLEIGFTLVRLAHDDFAARRPALQDWHDMFDTLCPESTRVKEMSFKEFSRISASIIGRLDLLHADQLKPLLNLRNACRDFGKGLSCNTRRGLPIHESHFDFAAHIGDFVLDFCIWGITDRKTDSDQYLFKRSEIVDGLADYCMSKGLPVWLTMAFHTYSDIFQIIGSHPQCVFDALSSEVGYQAQSVSAYCDTAVAALTEKGNAIRHAWENSRPMQSFTHATEQLYAKADPPNNKAEAPAEPPEQIKSILGLPCASGSMLWRTKLCFHELSINTAGDLGVILSLAHLYVACRRYGLISNLWPDMEFVIAQQETVQRFVMKANDKDPFTYVKHFLLALGVSATAFSRGQTPCLPSQKHAIHSNLVPMITSPYIRLMAQHQKQARNHAPRRGEFLVPVLTSMTDSDREKVPGRTSSDGEKSTPAELLNTFKKHLIQDEPHINFDYLSFWSFCQEMYMRLYIGARYHFLGDRAKSMTDPYRLVHHVLLEAAEARATRGRSFEGLIIPRMANVLEHIYKKDGDKFSKRAYSKSSGHIPKALRPKLKKCPMPSDTDSLEVTSRKDRLRQNSMAEASTQNVTKKRRWSV